MPFQPGNDLGGRTPGSRNKRDAELWSRLEARGDKDPAEFLSELVTNKEETKELRAQAASWLLPYKYSKRGATPIPPEPTYWNVEVRIKKAETVSQGRDNLQFISELKMEGRISERQAASLSAEHGKILDALIEETKLITANGAPEQIIRFAPVPPAVASPDGIGLAQLPGTDIILDDTPYGQSKVNGHTPPVIEHQNVSSDVSPEKLP
jgi:hypothetical protein